MPADSDSKNKTKVKKGNCELKIAKQATQVKNMRVSADASEEIVKSERDTLSEHLKDESK